MNLLDDERFMEARVPRKSRKKQDIEALKAEAGMTTAAELPPPDQEVIPPPPPSDNRHRPAPRPPLNGQEREGYVQKVRPDGPRRRSPHEPANVFSSKEARIDKDGQAYEITLAKEPDAELYAQFQRQGFDDVTEHDTGKQWVGYQSELVKAKTDINQVAFGLKQGRGR